MCLLHTQRSHKTYHDSSIPQHHSGRFCLWKTEFLKVYDCGWFSLSQSCWKRSTVCGIGVIQHSEIRCSPTFKPLLIILIFKYFRLLTITEMNQGPVVWWLKDNLDILKGSRLDPLLLPKKHNLIKEISV